MTHQEHKLADNVAKHVTVVLVLGAFVGASGRQKVFEILTQERYEVLVVQSSAVSLGDNVAQARGVVAQMAYAVVLVGHSYGGAVITEARIDEKVRCLVYLAAFVLEDRESVYDLASQELPGAEKAPLLPPIDGFIRVDPVKFPKAFAADIEPELADFMAVAQRPWGLEAIQGKSVLRRGEPSPRFT